MIESFYNSGKPVAAVWLEESTLDEARRLFATRRVPVHESPGSAVEAPPAKRRSEAGSGSGSGSRSSSAGSPRPPS